MKISVPLLSALLLAAAAVSLTAQVPAGQARDGQAASTADPRTAFIMGTVVVAGTGQPADGVRLSLSGNEIRGSRSALTDDDGRFAFLALPAGTYSLRASKTGYISATYGQKAAGRPGTPLVITTGQQIKDLSLEIPKGGVISGIIFDEKNRPSVSTPVRVLRWSMATGERVLSSAGTATTDDRGIYRIFGLSPGEYLVTATPRNTSTTVITSEDLQNLERLQSLGAMVSNVDGRVTFNIDTSEVNADPNVPKEPVSGYAPVYYPGTPEPGTARAVALGVSEEQLGIDFQLQRVTLSSVKGQVITPPGIATSTVQLRLRDLSTTAPGLPTFTARAGRDGAFTFSSVPPGQYEVLATATVSRPRPQVEGFVSTADMERALVEQASTTATKLWATATVHVDGNFQPNLVLTLQSGMTVSGSLAFNGTAPVPQALNRVRVSLSPHGQLMSSSGVGTTNVNVDANGRFTLSGVVPGQYRIRASGASGWTLKSVMAEGLDVLDFYLEVKPGEDVGNVVVGFGDTVTDVKGTLQGQMGEPTADYTVIIFPSDARYWVPLARRMRSARPSTDGAFSFTGLPAGDYRLAAVTDIEPGGWYDPALLRELQAASVGVRLVDGQPVVQDLRVSR